MSQTAFYSGILVFGGVQIPCFPGATFQDPKNAQNPPIIGNYYESPNYAPGLRVPMINVQFAIRDTMTEALSATLLGWLFNRTALPDHDTNTIGSDVKFWNGRKGWTLTGAKLDSISLSFSRGSLSMSARFVGTGKSALGAAPSFTAWDGTKLITGQNVTIWPSGALSPDCTVQGSLSISNNHRPSPCMNGSAYPAAMNASQLTAAFSLVRRTDASDLVDGDDIEIRIAGTTLTRSFFVKNPIWQTGDNLGIDVPENMQTWGCLVTGDPGNGAPITYT